MQQNQGFSGLIGHAEMEKEIEKSIKEFTRHKGSFRKRN